MDAIALQGLTKTWGAARGVTDLTLTVRQGEFYGLIGPNGAGKSTALRTLLGLLRPTAGTARVLGRDARADPAVLGRIGYLPAEVRFWPGMRVGQVLKFSAGLHGKNCAAAARALCARLGLDMRKKVETLSLGNRKKLGIVCALQHTPELLILDEPTSGLDPLIRREFFALLAEHNARGATVLLSSHDLGDVQRCCHRAAMLRQGRLAAVLEMPALAAAGQTLEEEFLRTYREGAAPCC